MNPGTKLEVAGGIKPGSATTGTSCSGNVEGSFGYDIAAHAPVYCNNVGVWAAMGGTATAGTVGGGYDGHGASWGNVSASGPQCSPVLPSCPAGYTFRKTAAPAVACAYAGSTNCGCGMGSADGGVTYGYWPSYYAYAGLCVKN